jgi:hypothetical protein
MAKEKKQEPKTAPEEAAEVPAGPPKSYRLQVTLGLAGLILFQMIVLWLLLPSRKDVEANIGLNVLEGVGNFEVPNMVPPEIVKKDPMVEKSLREQPFKIKDVNQETNVTLIVTVAVKIRKADERQFDKRYPACTSEVLDRITTIFVASTDDERHEVGLTGIKEKIKRGINEVLGMPWVQEVFCTDFSLESQ